MKESKKSLLIGITGIIAFILWTILIQTVDVEPVGQNGTTVGFAMINTVFHNLTGVHMSIYTITDWLGLVPIFICLGFGGVGFVQLIKRKSLFKVDFDIIALGVYYIIVIMFYLVFEMIPINYRPILIDGFMEASYPSSTTLLVLSVMPTLVFQINRRIKAGIMAKIIVYASNLFSIFMVLGRTIAGVHWLTDIIGSLLISAGLFLTYKGIVLNYDERHGA